MREEDSRTQLRLAAKLVPGPREWFNMPPVVVRNPPIQARPLAPGEPLGKCPRWQDGRPPRADHRPGERADARKKPSPHPSDTIPQIDGNFDVNDISEDEIEDSISMESSNEETEIYSNVV